VRPLRLEIEGLTSFRDRVVLDFDGLDLFAVTGPTGAGKSSLIDALVLALYGQAPRVSDRYRQLISQGSERMSLRLDFQVDGERYRIARTIRAVGTPQFRLERLVNGRSEPLADRAREIDERVKRIVGLDYDAFVRSVVLPQGQFDAFLKGKPEERRKILVALLRLGVYEQMQRLANARAAQARTEAAYIANQLAVDFAEATAANLEASRRAVGDALEQQARLEADAKAIDEGVKLAQGVRSARRDSERLAREIEAEVDRLARAEQTRERAAKGQQDVASRLAEIQKRSASSGFDQTRHLVLVDAKPRAEQLKDLALKRERLAGEREGASAAFSRRCNELGKTRAEVLLAGKGLEEARAALETARGEREALHRRHAAAGLRRHLEPGEACPVCEQVVKKLPKKAELPALAAADGAVRTAEKAAEEAARKLERARLQAERLAAETRALEAQVDHLQRQAGEVTAAVKAVVKALRPAVAGVGDGANAAALVSRLARELEALERAKAERDRLETERGGLEAERARLLTESARAAAQAETAGAHLSRLRGDATGTALALESAREKLLALARRHGWSRVEEPVLGRDEADVLEARRSALQGELSTLAGKLARLRADVERLETAIARSAELLARKQALEAEAALASVLAQHLQANQFIAHVQEEALRVLAEDGSRHLKTLSQGRYSLSCEDQDFLVVDHWNADLPRSVKTLSGGETFLASLALALALAERLAELSAEGRTGETLESLFLDEGFGSLDAETLDVVVQAIEALQDGERMVGVVTHIRELAERLPARIEVARSERSATVSVM
jgi:exonuclease SbcC